MDPELGRIVFPRDRRKKDIWVSYHYGFSADIGGGEYDRLLSQPKGATVFQVSKDGPVKSIDDALKLIDPRGAPHAVIEIADSGVYDESITVKLAKDRPCRSAQRGGTAGDPPSRVDRFGVRTACPSPARPAAPSPWTASSWQAGSVQVHGDLAALTLRHSTLVPGWGFENDCEPRCPTSPASSCSTSPLRG